MNYKYDVFISYSHKDKYWGDWLYKKLNSYKVPKELVGTKNKIGEAVPSKFKRIFRDIDQTPAHSNLSDVINNALLNSKYLIVICSPNAHKSKWVNEEIRLFKKLHGEDKVLALIVDGIPNATYDDNINNDLEAFPHSLRYKLDLNYDLSEQKTEPLAANLQAIADGKLKAEMKLIAGLLQLADLQTLMNDELKRIKKNKRNKLSVFILIICLFLFSLYQLKKSIAQVNIIKKEKEISLELLAKSEHNLGKAYLEKANRLFHDDKEIESRLFLLSGYLKIKDKLKNETILNNSDLVGNLSLNEKKQNSYSILDKPNYKVFISRDNKNIFYITNKNTNTQVSYVAHKSNITSVDIHEKSGLVLSGSKKGIFILWNLYSGDIIWEKEAHTGLIIDVKFSNIGKSFLTSSFDNSIKVWDIKKKKIQNKFILSNDPSSPSFTKDDDKIIASNFTKNRIKVFDLFKNKNIKIINSAFLFKTIIGMNKFIVNKKNRLEIWNLKTLKILKKISYDFLKDKYIISPNGKYLVLFAKDKKLRVIYDLEKEELLMESPLSGKVSHLLFSFNSSFLIYENQDKLHVIETEKWNIIYTYKNSKRIIYETNINGDNLIIKFKDGFKTVNLRKILETKLKVHKYDITKLYKHNEMLYSDSKDFTIKRINLKSFTLDNYIIRKKYSHVYIPSFTSKDISFVGIDADHIIESNRTKLSLPLFTDGNSSILTQSVSHDKKIGAVSRLNNLIEIIDLEKLEHKFFLNKHTDKINDIKFSRDNAILFSSSNDKTIKIWNLSKGKLISSIKYKYKVNNIELLDNSDLLVLSNKNKEVIIWNYKLKKTIKSIKLYEPINEIAISHDKNKILVATKGILNIYNMELQLLKTINLGKDIVTSVLILDKKEEIILGFKSGRIGRFNISIHYNLNGSYNKIKEEIKLIESLLKKRIVGFDLVNF